MSFIKSLVKKNRSDIDGLQQSHLISYSNTVTLVSSTPVVSIGIPEFDSVKDTLFVFSNSTFLAVTSDYVITSNSIITKASGNWNLGTVFNFIVIKGIHFDDMFDYATQVYTYNGQDQLTSIVWKDSSNVTVRTDTFSYVEGATEDTTTEVRSITGKPTITIVTTFNKSGSVLGVTKS